MIIIKNITLLLVLFLLASSVSVVAQECPENTYLRTNPETKAKNCCPNPKSCVTDKGICSECPRCEKVIYENKFNELSEDLIAFKGEWKITQDIQPNGLYGNILSQSSTYGESLLWIGDPDWEDYTIEINAKIKSAKYSDVIGVVYYLYRTDEYYEYRINNRIIRRKKIGPTPETIELAPPKATTCNKADKWCKIKIKTFQDKDRIVWTKIYVNDIEVHNTSIGEAKGLSGGRIALKTYSASVYFDDLIISETEWQNDKDLDEVPDRCDYCDDTPYGCLIYLNGCPVDLDNDKKCDTILEVLYDLDKDGHISEEIGGDDCNDNDKEVNPEAKEICSNSQDEDCDERIDCDDADCKLECQPETELGTEESKDLEEFIEKEIKEKKEKGFFKKILDWFGF